MRTPKPRVQQTQDSGLTKFSKSLLKHWQKRLHDGPEPTTTELQTKHNKELTSHMKQPCLNSKPKSTTNTRRCSNGATKKLLPKSLPKMHQNTQEHEAERKTGNTHRNPTIKTGATYNTNSKSPQCLQQTYTLHIANPKNVSAA